MYLTSEQGHADPARKGPGPWYLYKMVAQIMLRRYDIKQVFSEKQIGFDYSFDVNTCLEQLEMPELLYNNKNHGPGPAAPTFCESLQLPPSYSEKKWEVFIFR